MALHSEQRLQADYLIVCVGTTGDIHPFIRLAKALQELGRRVTFITNNVHTGLLEQSGLRTVGVGTREEYQRIIEDPDLWHPTRGFAVLMAHYKDQLLQLDAAIRSSVNAQQPTVLIAHPLAVPGAAIAKDSGLITRVVSVHLAPSTLRTCHDPMRVGHMTVPRWVPMRWRHALWRLLERGWIDPVGLRQVNEARRALQLPPVASSYMTHLERSPDLTLLLFPAWFGPPMPDWPQPQVPGHFQLFDAEASSGFSPELSTFLAAGDRPLVFTPGTGNVHAKRFFGCALATTLELGQRAIFLTRYQTQIPAKLPPTVLWQPYVPLSGFLPHAKALIHHGGIGTTAEALRGGTPQLVTPFAWDQFDNGARVAELGVGLTIPADSLSRQKLTRALRWLIHDEAVPTRCKEIALRFSEQQDTHALCQALEASLQTLEAQQGAPDSIQNTA